MAIWNILRHFGTFFQFWYHLSRKIWQPCAGAQKSTKVKLAQCEISDHFFTCWDLFLATFRGGEKNSTDLGQKKFDKWMENLFSHSSEEKTEESPGLPDGIFSNTKL
jgi:hypothetical protein